MNFLLILFAAVLTNSIKMCSNKIEVSGKTLRYDCIRKCKQGWGICRKPCYELNQEENRKCFKNCVPANKECLDGCVDLVPSDSKEECQRTKVKSASIEKVPSSKIPGFNGARMLHTIRQRDIRYSFRK